MSHYVPVSLRVSFDLIDTMENSVAVLFEGFTYDSKALKLQSVACSVVIRCGHSRKYVIECGTECR